MFYRVRYPGMAWAIYRELEVHLAQILSERPQILLRTDPIYDYNLDQVESLLFSPPADNADRALVCDVLLHYLERWRTMATKVGSVTVYQGAQELRMEETDRKTWLAFLTPTPN
ncbi:MAG: hypothetical protein WCA07_07665 [Gloeobacterales cyanobacterium]